MVCRVVKKAICQHLQDHYIEHHLVRYIKTLRNKEYLQSIDMTREKADSIISILWSKSINLQQYDEIKDGRRVRKQSCILKECVNLD